GGGLVGGAASGRPDGFPVGDSASPLDVVLSYDIGNGIRAEKGGETFSHWPRLQQGPNLPKTPRASIETLTHYFRYTANLARLNSERVQGGCILRNADLLAPALQGGFNYDIQTVE